MKATLLSIAGVILLGLAWFGFSHWQQTRHLKTAHTDVPITEFSKGDFSPELAKHRFQGVRSFQATKSAGGYSLYSPRDRAYAYLLDMDGNIVHQWHHEQPDQHRWRTVHLDGGGNLYAIGRSKYFIYKYDWNNKLLWKIPAIGHHDITTDPQGRVVLLTRRDSLYNYQGHMLPIIQCSLLHLDAATGRRLASFTLTDQVIDLVKPKAFHKNIRWSERREIEKQMQGWDEVPTYILRDHKDYADLIHINSLAVLQADIPGVGDAGDFLISYRNLDMIGVVDQNDHRVKWSWGPGELDYQHNATVLESGNFLIFDNGRHRKYSRAVEMDPRTKQIVWQYLAEPRESLFTRYQGAAQRLPNGNTMITSTRQAWSFEVTSEGQLVWEFFGNEIDHEHEGRRYWREIMYRVVRIVGDQAKMIERRLASGQS